MNTGPGSFIRKILNLLYLAVEWSVIDAYSRPYAIYWAAQKQEMAAELAIKGTYLYIHWTRFMDPQWFLGLIAYLVIVVGLIIGTYIVNQRFDIAWIAKWVAWLGYPLIYWAIPAGIKAWDYLWWAVGLSAGPVAKSPLPPIEASPDVWGAAVVFVGIGCLLPFLCILGAAIIFLIVWRMSRPDHWVGFSLLSAVLTAPAIPLMFYIGEMLAGVYNHPDMATLGVIISGIIFIDFLSYIPIVRMSNDDMDSELYRKIRGYTRNLRIATVIGWLFFDILVFGLLASPLIAQMNFSIGP